MLSPPKDGLKLLIEAPNLPNTAKMFQKLTFEFCSAWGRRCTWCAGGALTKFPCELRLNIFLRLGLQVHPLHPLATPMWPCPYSPPDILVRLNSLNSRTQLLYFHKNIALQYNMDSLWTGPLYATETAAGTSVIYARGVVL